MSAVDQHYEHLLAQHYSWMFGVSFEERVNEQKAFLSHALEPLESAPEDTLAVDLGCGPGFQTISWRSLAFLR